MALSLLRLDMRAPETGAPPRDLYAAALDMAEFADEVGFTDIVLSEHHQTEDGFLPAPLVMAAGVAARTSRIRINVGALLVPLHDPIRLAEQLAVLDLVSGGRVSVTAGLGYRREEYDAAGLDWSRRGAIFDECLEVILNAWTGEAFEYQGRSVRVLPRPGTQPHPIMMIGGSTQAAVRRAIRFGLPLAPAVDDPELVATYKQLAAENGVEGGFVVRPGKSVMVNVSDDPAASWREYGPYFLHDARTYASWQTPDIRSHVMSHATTVEELQEEGRYRILTPAECLEYAAEEGRWAAFIHFPLVGGAPPELGWRSLRLYAEEALPHLSQP
ncbi:MAG: LLM class flavin-dependent oxidoreductase [Acidimicrobiia bacterium]|nr:LLM class flavin-dependent oxidoreductase [Acidimicrobiia bacterium]